MHSNILFYILDYALSWITSYQFPWDGGSFTILDVIIFHCMLFVVFYFISHIVFFLIRQYERYLGI